MSGVNKVIHQINRDPVDSAVCFVNKYPLNSDFSGGERYPAFEQLGTGLYSLWGNPLGFVVFDLRGRLTCKIHP